MERLSFKSSVRFQKSTILLIISLISYFNVIAQPGKDGNLTVSSLGQLVNRYTRITSNVTAGSTTITVNNIASDLGTLTTGDLIMVYQAQGASIRTTNDVNYGSITSYNGAGLYEFIYVNSVAGNVITVSCGLKNSYSVSGKSQVIKVPLYNNLTINSGASIIAKAWDGNTGGIVAIHVKGILTNSGTIDVSTKGFRGGKRDNNTLAAHGGTYDFYVTTSSSDGAEKGESIAGYGPEYDLLGGRYCRGAPANGGGGGNAHNHGGGGGANGDNGRPWTGAGVMDPNPAYLAAWMLDPDYIANGNALTNSSGGGRGGYSYSANNANALTTGPNNSAWGGDWRQAYGSRGGRPLQSDIENRIFFGGGGGAGDGNNNASNDGGDGGGIAFIVAKTFIGTGKIKADGANGLNTVAAGNDAPGGGGGGGTIVVKANTLNNQTLSANGGNGGNQFISGNEAEGCGGGGGGGVIATPPNGAGTCGITSSYIYISGRNGLSNSAAVTEFLPNGGTWGADGKYDIKVSAGFIPYTITCLVDLDGDGIDDRSADIDIDNDGILNTDEGYMGISGAADTDADLIPNYSDPDFMPYIDSNCDGINDIFDYDLDSTPDCIDLDSDNDGITDCIEAGGNDADGDGIYDSFSDANNDGLHDAAGAGLAGNDMEGDGLKNQRDRDTDGDGITDCIEAGGTDSNGDGIIDSFADNDDDGYSDNVDPKTGRLTFSGSSTGISPLSVPDSDSDAKKNFTDIDSDNDGISDNVEAQTTAGYRIAILQDTDSDGIFDVYDTDNGGTVITLTNTDGSDLPDYLDADSDNDGVPDNIEANDANSDGNPVPTIPVSNADSDGDGLVNSYDNYIGWDISVAGYNGTGSISPLQDTDNDNIKDWRDTDDDNDCINTASTGAGNENSNSNSAWNDDFDQNGAPIPNYLFAQNSFSVIGASRCGDGTVNLNATSANQGNFNWYTVPSGGSPVFTQNSVTTSTFSPSITATTNYYVEFTVGSCVSTRKLVVATKIDNSFSPTVTPGSVCGTGSVTLAASTGSTGTFRWYDAVSGGNLIKTESNTTSSTYITPVLSVNTTFYVEFDNGTCTGQRTPVLASVSSPPPINVTDGYTCGTTSATLTATASGPGTFNWYNSTSGGLLLQSVSNVVSDEYVATSITSNTDFYVEYSNGCLTPRYKVSALINAALTPPSTTSNTNCGTGSVILSASGSVAGTFQWYDASTGGNLVQTTSGVSNDNFTTPSLSADKTYYVSFSNIQCTSSRTAATAYIVASANINAPNGSRCGTGTVFLTATSSVPGTFRWYSAASGGILLLTSSTGVLTSTYETASITAGNSTTYYVEFTSASPVCTISPRKAVTATASTTPVITPSGTLSNSVYTTNVCSAGTQTLTATSDQAGTFKWYDASSGGSLVYSQSDNTNPYNCSFTTPYLSSSTDYYLEFDNGTCTTSRQDVRINVIGTSEPTVNEASRCGPGTVVLSAISQTPSQFRWYDAPTGGTLLQTSGNGVYNNTYTTPSISSTTTYYVEYTSSGCTSPRVPVVATVNSAPSAPLAIDGSRCGGAGTVLIGAYSASNTNILWYSASTGGTALFTENGVSVSNFTTPSIASTTIYYAETHNGTCASTSRTAVNAVVTTGTAVVPTASSVSNCGSGSFSLTANYASSGVFRWYDASSGGNLLKTEPAVTSSSYTTPVLSSSTNYYVAFDRGIAGTCPTASRVVSAVTINSVPPVPTVTDNSVCGAGSVALTATSSTSGNFYWYDVPSGGSVLNTELNVLSSTYPTPSISTNTSYYVAFGDGSCTSNRVKINAIVYGIPNAPVGINSSNCGAGNVTLGATSSGNGNFLWYDAPGGNLLLTDHNTSNSSYNTGSILSNTDYYVYFNNGTCTSSGTTVSAFINPAPVAPIVTGAERCGVGSLSLNAESTISGTFRWYTASTGGALLQTNSGVTSSTFITPVLSSSTTYYVEFFDGTCPSTRVPVNADINTCVTLSVDNPVISETGGIATFTISLSSISTVDVIVNLNLSGTATGPDYSNSNTSVTIPAGSLSGTFTVTATEDDIYEGNSNESIIVDIASVINGSEVGNQQQTTEISDNETAPTVVLTANPLSIGENNIISIITVTLSGTTYEDVNIALGYTGSAFGSDVDYSGGATMLTIPAGQLTATTLVTSVEDAFYEGDETIIVDINNVTGGGATENGNQQANILIIENDPPLANLEVAKIVNNFTPNVGENVTFTLTVTNHGSNTATSVSLNDLLPSGYSYVSDNGAGAYVPGTGVWTIGSLANGATATLDITATVNASGSYANTASVSSPTADPVPGNNSSTSTPVPVPQANLSITKNVSNGTPNVGSNVVFTLSVTNNGPSTAASVSVNDLLPSGYSYVSDNGAGAYVPGTGVWTIGSLANGATATLDITATVNASGSYANTASVSSPTADPVPGNNSSTSTPVPVPQANLSITKNVSNGTPNVGSNVVFTLSVTNNGPSTAASVSVNDLLPSGYLYVSDNGAGAYVPGTGVWTIGSLANGATATLDITATVNASGSYANTASVSSPTTDPVPGNNSSTSTPVPVPQANLVMTKNVSNGTPNVGSNVVFTLSVTNNGPSTAASVSANDLLPSGYSFVSDNGAGAYVPGTGVWTIGSMADGATATLDITATVNASGSYANTASVSSPTADPVPGNNSATSTPVPVPQANLSITKNVSNGTPNVGSNVVFTLSVTNNGPSTAASVSVIDLLPSGYSYISDNGAGAYVPGTGIWTIGSLANGASATLDITATVNASGSYANTASVSSPTADPVSANNSATSTPVPVPQANLSITKNVSNGTPNVGSNVVFTLSVTNNGPSTAASVSVNDLLPSGYSYVSDNGAGAYVPGTGVWTIGSLANGASVSLDITATVNASGSYANTASVSSPTADPVPGNNSSTSTPVPVPQANLVVTKSVNNTNPVIGENVIFTLNVTNNGPSDATGVIVTDNLPDGYTFIAANPLTGSWNSPNWTIGNLADGATASLEITAQVNSFGNFLNTATVIGDQPDPVSGNENDGVSINGTDLVTTKTVNNNMPNAGEDVIFTITVKNNGPANATGVIVTDNIPNGYTIVNVLPTKGNWIYPNWNVGNLDNGATESVQITARIEASGNYTNTVSVKGDQPDPVKGNENDTASVLGTDLVITKIVNNSNPNIGDNVIFTINVVNNGPRDATGVVVTDLLPDGYTFVSALPTQGSWTYPDWNLGNLDNGKSESIQITATVNEKGNFLNSASVKGDQPDPVPGNESDGTAINGCDIVITKTIDKNNPLAGDNVIFTITATNNGPGNATGVVLTDNLPDGYTFVNANPSAGSWNSPEWTIGNLANGATETLQITALVNQKGNYNNIASVIADQPDPAGGNEIDSVTITGADLSVTKTVDKFNPNVGDNVVFTITVTNNGTLDATGVTVTDLLPDGYTFVSANPSSGTWNDPTWTISNLANGVSETLQITALVNATGIYVNTVSVISDQPDPVPGNENDLVSPVPKNQADLKVTKTVDNLLPNVGQNVVFTITVANNGPSDATGVIVTDNLPDGYAFVSATPSAGSWNSPDWTLGNLANGASANIQITATVLVSGSYANTATVIGNEPDPTPGNETDLVIPVPNKNTSPTAQDDNISVDENSLNNILDVLADNGNGTDNFGTDGPSSTDLSILTAPQHGAATVDNNGTPNDPTDDVIIYTPSSDFDGSDSFTYQICDANGDCSTGTVNVTVNNVNQPPVAASDYLSIKMNSGTVTINVTQNDTDPDNDLVPESAVLVKGSTNGSQATIDNNGNIVYTPAEDFFGIDTLIYKVYDAAGLFDTDTLFITVESEIKVTNTFSPNNDGINDKLYIKSIDGTDNEIFIYNRWGNEVFHVENYRNDVNAWNGRAQNKTRFGGDEVLPVGTYFYILYIKGSNKPLKGYIYLQY
ncbi:MAG: Ig-like domain-containing protein [Bacteroidales bacterium]